VPLTLERNAATASRRILAELKRGVPVLVWPCLPRRMKARRPQGPAPPHCAWPAGGKATTGCPSPSARRVYILPTRAGSRRRRFMMLIAGLNYEQRRAADHVPARRL
jgi:hypothetical protein